MGRRPDGSVRVVVADNGVGMPASQDTSFEPKTLGFRLVTDLAKQLDGSVTVSVEQGTRVQVDFQRVN
jgi:two-component sensor histidine kinase